MNFEFMTANRICFESGSIQKLGHLVRQFGTRAILSTGMSEEKTSQIVSILKESGIETTVLRVNMEPCVEELQEMLLHYKTLKPNMLIGFGGGSAMDTAKALSALITNPDNIFDYLEVIGLGKPLLNKPLPFIAIPTTSGTGAEVTRNAVLRSKKHKVKVSLRSPMMLAELVLMDPQLTVSVPPSVTASTGLDALTQVIEPYVSNKANPVTDAFCKEGINRVGRSLKAAYDNGNNIRAREDMAIASLFGGLALANAKLGVVHGFASVLGGMLGAPHGMICAAVLSASISVNVETLRQRDAESEYLRRYDEIGRILTERENANASDAVEWVDQICRHLQVQPLSALGLKETDFPTVIRDVKVASSTTGNPVVLTDEELEQILKLSF